MRIGCALNLSRCLLDALLENLKLTNVLKMSRETYELNHFYRDISNFWPLDIQTAASLGDIPFFVKYVGKLNDQLHVANSFGWTPLMYACSRGHSLLVNYLLSSGASRGSKTKSGVTPLMLSVTSGDMPTVESVFDVSNLEEKDYRQWTALFYSVCFTRERCLQFLLNKGANVDIVDFQNETPLMQAIKLGRDTMIELILQSATNLNVVSFNQESALMLAEELCSLKIKALVRQRYEYLKELNKRRQEQSSNTAVTKASSTPRTKNLSLLQHCSPAALKQHLKCHMKMGKSFSYSPGKASKESQILVGGSQLKVAMPKKLWSPQFRCQNNVQQFLNGLGLEKYWPIFRDEEVDFETLLMLNEENLKELGIVLFGPRKKIASAIQQLRKHYFKSCPD